MFLAEPKIQRDPQGPSRSTGWAGAHSSPVLAAGAAGVVGKPPASSRSSARLLGCPRCQAVPLLALGTRSHHLPPALLVPLLLLRKLHLATACRAPFRFTVFHCCVSGTWRRTAACVLCTLTSDRTLAGNGSTSPRATLPTSVQALAHTFAAQTPLTARYIHYIVLLVAGIAPSP